MAVNDENSAVARIGVPKKLREMIQAAVDEGKKDNINVVTLILPEGGDTAMAGTTNRRQYLLGIVPAVVALGLKMGFESDDLKVAFLAHTEVLKDADEDVVTGSINTSTPK